MTATAEQLQLMLYDGAIRFALQARDAVEASDYESSYNKLSRAQAIVLEMQNGLRHEVNPDLCDKMAALYSFLYRKLVDASVNRRVADLNDALQVLRHMRETWVMLMDKTTQARAQSELGEPGADNDEPATATATTGPAGGSLSVEG
jgi:flagellar protein FliS